MVSSILFTVAVETLHILATEVMERVLCRASAIKAVSLEVNILGASPAYNYMLFSGMGGLDFAKAEIAPEQGCIYIYDTIGYCHLMKPSSLLYERFSDNSKWNYFLLELSNLESIENHAGNDTFEYERLVEDKPGHYVSAKAAQYGAYDYDSGEPLPEGYKVVQRYVAEAFCLF